MLFQKGIGVCRQILLMVIRVEIARHLNRRTHIHIHIQTHTRTDAHTYIVILLHDTVFNNIMNMFTDSLGKRKRSVFTQVVEQEIQECEYVKVVFEMCEGQAVSQSRELSELIGSYMLERWHLKAHVSCVKRRFVGSKRRRWQLSTKRLSSGEVYEELLRKYLVGESRCWKAWTRLLNKTQLREAFPIVLYEMKQLLKELKNINMDIWGICFKR